MLADNPNSNNKTFAVDVKKKESKVWQSVTMM